MGVFPLQGLPPKADLETTRELRCSPLSSGLKTITSSPITSWQIDGETMETVRDFIFLGSKITVDSDCSHEIKRPLLLGRKAMTNLDDSVLKSRMEPIIQSEVSQKEKHQYSILTHIYGI